MVVSIQHLRFGSITKKKICTAHRPPRIVNNASNERETSIYVAYIGIYVLTQHKSPGEMFCGHVADLAACWAPPDGRGRVENDLHLCASRAIYSGNSPLN